MESKIEDIFSRAFLSEGNKDLSELKQFQSMYMEYLHLMMKINVMANQMPKKPEDFELT